MARNIQTQTDTAIVEKIAPETRAQIAEQWAAGLELAEAVRMWVAASAPLDAAIDDAVMGVSASIDTPDAWETMAPPYMGLGNLAIAMSDLLKNVDGSGRDAALWLDHALADFDGKTSTYSDGTHDLAGTLFPAIV